MKIPIVDMSMVIISTRLRTGGRALTAVYGNSNSRYFYAPLFFEYPNYLAEGYYLAVLGVLYRD